MLIRMFFIYSLPLITANYSVVVIGYNPVPCRTNEGVEGLNVQVDLLFGVLARNVSVTLQTLENEGSASGQRNTNHTH